MQRNSGNRLSNVILKAKLRYKLTAANEEETKQDDVTTTITPRRNSSSLMEEAEEVEFADEPSPPPAPSTSKGTSSAADILKDFERQVETKPRKVNNTGTSIQPDTGTFMDRERRNRILNRGSNRESKTSTTGISSERGSDAKIGKQPSTADSNANKTSSLGGFFDDADDDESIGALSLQYGLGQREVPEEPPSFVDLLFSSRTNTGSHGDSTANLGSTILANTSQRHQPVDQSVNLMDTSLGFYSPTDDLDAEFQRNALGSYNPNNKRTSWCSTNCFLKLMLMTGIFAAVALLTHRQSDAIAGGMAPPSNETTTGMEEALPVDVEPLTAPSDLLRVQSFILQSSLTASDDLADPQSSAYQALQWMQKFEDKLEEDSKLQLYVLAVFYYSTHPYESSASTTENRQDEENDHPSLRRKTVSINDKVEATEGGTVWMEDLSTCDWKGIRCSPEGVVTHIKMPHGNLQGTIPSELRGLKNLLELDFSHNQLHGSIPSTIGELTGLTYVDLKMNNVTGTLPESLGKLTNLHAINVDNNRLEGSIPVSMHDLAAIQYLVLSNNRLDGSIPPFAKLPELRVLDLDNNKLTGSVPFDSLSLLENLEEIRAESNLLSSTIAASIADLRSIKKVSLKNNSLSGTLPDVFQQQQHSMVDLDLSMNKLGGVLPPSMGNLNELQYLKLSENELTGPVPAAWAGMKSLHSLIMDHNKLEGSLPADLSNMGQLRDLRLNHNVLTGVIPEDLGTLDDVEHIHLESNRFTGEIPASFGGLVDTLVTIELFHNNITGDAAALCSHDTSKIQIFTTDCLSDVSCDCCTECY